MASPSYSASTAKSVWPDAALLALNAIADLFSTSTFPTIVISNVPQSQWPSHGPPRGRCRVMVLEVERPDGVNSLSSNLDSKVGLMGFLDGVALGR